MGRPEIVDKGSDREHQRHSYCCRGCNISPRYDPAQIEACNSKEERCYKRRILFAAQLPHHLICDIVLYEFKDPFNCRLPPAGDELCPGSCYAEHDHDKRGHDKADHDDPVHGKNSAGEKVDFRKEIFQAWYFRLSSS